MILTPHKREQVIPLPVALISTISADGIRNIAPWSNITPILRPLDEIILASWIKRDTLTNILETGEFVVNIPPAGMEDAIMVCSRHYPPDVDEFNESGLIERPSITVTPPGIQGCIAWMECRFVEEIRREKFSLIIGRVTHLEVDDRWIRHDGIIDYTECKPLGVMLGNDGMEFTHPSFSGRYAKYEEMFSLPENMKNGGIV